MSMGPVRDTCICYLESATVLHKASAAVRVRAAFETAQQPSRCIDVRECRYLSAQSLRVGSATELDIDRVIQQHDQTRNPGGYALG
jgi:hypothetical protein